MALDEPAIAADSEKLLRRKPVPTYAFHNDFELPPLCHSTSPQKATDSHTVLESGSSTDRASQSGHQRQRLQWTPPILKRPSLLGFIAVFSSLFTALAILFGYSQGHQGLSTADQRLYYIWTYGPTAVLSVLAASWAQVVYRTKQLTPWRSMAVEPQVASKSVLLDYVSPIGPVALLRALSNAHHTVSAGIISSLILLGLTVLSTGLFSPQHVEVVTNNVSLLTTNEFDFAGFDWASTDARPAEIVYATSVLGLKYPAGTTAQYAVQDFSETSGSNATLSSTVDVFSSRLDCQPAKLMLTNVSAYSPSGALFHSGATFKTNVSSSDCTLVDFEFNSPTLLDSNTPYNSTEFTEWGYGQLGTCIEDSSLRVLLSAGNYVINQRWNASEGAQYIALALPYDQMFRIINSTNLICKPLHKIESMMVVKHANSTLASQFVSIDANSGSIRHINGSQATDITRAVFQSVSDPTTQAQYQNSSLSYNTFFNILQNPAFVKVDGTLANQYWHHSDNLERWSGRLYQSIAAQVAALKLLSPANRTIDGQVTENKWRLFVRPLSFGLIEAGLVMLVAITVYILATASDAFRGQDPGSIDGLATILCKSPAFTKQLDGLGSCAKHQIDSALTGYVYHTGRDGQILSSYRSMGSATSGADKESSFRKSTYSATGKFWEPSMLQIPVRILVILVPVIYIIILEVLLTFSRSHNGIVSIDTNSWLHYGWTYIPATMMVIVGVGYDDVNASIKTVNPYINMGKGSARGVISIQDQPLARTSLHDLYSSGKHGQIAVFATTIGVFLATLLPIAVSGLYTPVNHGQNIDVHSLTGWNFNEDHYLNTTILNDTFISMHQPYSGYLDPETLKVLTTLVESANLSYISRTYDELALPLLNASIDSPPTLAAIKGSVTVTVPAVRGSLNCTVAPRGKVDVKYDTNYTSYGSLAPQPQGNRQSLNYTLWNYQSMLEPDDDARFALFSISDVSWLGGCSIEPALVFLPHSGSKPYGFFTTVRQMRNHTYCPTYLGMVGIASTTVVQDYTWFFCDTEAERVDALTTLSLPDYTIVDASADENTATNLPGNATNSFFYPDNGDWESITFTGPNSALSGGGTTLDPNEYLSFYNMTDGQNYDNFFSCLVYGRDGVPCDELIGKENESRLLSAVQHLWRVVYAQQFSMGSGLSANAEDVRAWASKGALNGTLLNPSSYRLEQDIVSTRILQGTLAALVLCATVAFVCIGSTKRLLPNNPSSIAVVASLLAESELLKVVEKRQNELRGSQQQKDDPWAGYLFSMGWWDREDGGRRFGIDIGRADHVA